MSLNNAKVNVVVNDRQDRTNVAGMIKPRGILLLASRLICRSLERSCTAASRQPVTRLSATTQRTAGARGTERMMRSSFGHAFRRWHLGHRYSVSGFTCSS